MTTYYVNQAGTANSWTTGVDASGNGTTTGDPFLTWQYAHVSGGLVATDTLVFNSDGTTEYDAPNTAASNKLQAASPSSTATYNSDGDYEFSLVTYDVSADEWIAGGAGGFGVGGGAVTGKSAIINHNIIG